MQIRLGELKEAVRKLLETYSRTRVVDTRLPWEKQPDAYDEPEKRKGSIEKGLASQAGETEDEIEAMRASPEFRDLDAFMEYKLADESYEYDWKELQALVRNFAAKRLGHLAKATINPGDMVVPADIAVVKKELGDMGFNFVPRQPQKQIRGATSNSHGTHPFANSGGGGSGFSSDRGGGGGFTAFGGGPGAVGGGVPWDRDSKKNLPMGARRR